MSISFKCSQCGKDYVVSDGLAGKSAICKGCGARMTVPGEPSELHTEVVPAEVGSGPGEPSLTDATAIGAGATAAPSGTPFSGPRFSPSKPPSSGGGAGRFIVLAIVVGLAVVGGIRKLGLSSKSDVRAFHQRQYDLGQQFVAGLKGIKDVASAKAASGPIKGTLQQMTENLEKNGRKKGKKTDIDEVSAEFQPKNQQLESQVMQEMMRVAVIPGALDALDISEPLERLSKLEEEMGKEGKK